MFPFKLLVTRLVNQIASNSFPPGCAIYFNYFPTTSLNWCYNLVVYLPAEPLRTSGPRHDPCVEGGEVRLLLPGHPQQVYEHGGGAVHSSASLLRDSLDTCTWTETRRR